MTWRTHAAIGANAGMFALSLFGGSTPLLGVFIGAFGGIVPDIDATYAKIHTIGLFGLARGDGDFHRKFFHSLLAVALLAGAAQLFFSGAYRTAAFAFVFGYFSHMFIDGMNYAGVMYLWPWQKKIRLLPKMLRSRVGSAFDDGLFFMGIIGLFAQLLPYITG
ncbi:MAG: metal-dependent hydrolase [bacterium]|nr:metal-dependent hydrolase [bacterium]